MLTSSEFVCLSLETHLFFARIMKEHSFFLQVGFTPRDTKFTEEANRLRMEFDKLLLDVVNISNGVVRPRVLQSGEVVTPYTLKAEEVSTFYTGVMIPTNITKAELELRSGDCKINDPKTENNVSMINQRAIILIKSIIEFKTNILTNVLACKMFTVNYPLLIDHILREAKLYLTMVKRIEDRDFVGLENDIYGQELFWNRIMAEHSKFIRGLLDPTENELINVANNFANEFDDLTKDVIKAINSTLPIEEVTRESLQATKRISEFNKQGTIGLLDCKIESIILPLLGDHVLRESNHFLRLLKSFAKVE